MIGNFYFKIPPRLRLFIFFIFIILLAYFILRFLIIEPKNIPKNFLEARQNASSIAKEIVSLSDQSVNNLDEIAKLDKEQKYTEALMLVSQELERNQEARGEAVQLSVQLEQMAKSLSKISPASASQIALEAISSETALISRLINYNDYLTQLLNVLRGKFLGKVNGDNVPELIAKINNEAQTINDQDKKFNSLMKQFDAEF